MTIRRALGVLAAICILPATGWGLTVTPLLSSDPSLAGVQVASSSYVLNREIVLGPGTDPVITPVLRVEQQVVRNGGGTLDFYYQVFAAPGTTQPLFELNVPTAPGSGETFAYVADGSGTLAPKQVDLLPADAIFPAGSARFLFPLTFVDSGVPFFPESVPNLTPEGTRTLLMRTTATTFERQSLFALLVDGDAGEIFGPAEAFAPVPAGGAAVPEPASLGLLALAVAGLALRQRRPLA